ncbi:major capsid protein [Synechococcus lacustris]|uniref:major capsid protein n=1 Tax=Synechococcus lacustris TaxID=2116544 RepID=UPI003341FD11
MGLTLIEAAKYENRLEHLAVLKTFSEGELLARLPFMNIAGSGLFYSAEQELPSVGFRAVNEGYSQSYGVVDQRAEAVHLFGGDVDVDRSIVDLMGPEARASQVEMKVRSMRLTLEATVINGDSSANPRAFDGLSKRLPPGDAMAFDNSANAAVGGAGLNFDRLDELIDSVNAYGAGKVLVMSKAMRRQLNGLARNSIGGVYQTSTNSFGMTVHRYQDCDIVTVDRDAQGIEVMGYDEAGGTSSIYCCTFGDQGVTGLQGPFQGRYGISVRDLGEVPDAPVFRTRVDWYVGFAVLQSRAAGRLFNISPAGA